jgi:hypothetical protein
MQNFKIMGCAEIRVPPEISCPRLAKESEKSNFISSKRPYSEELIRF